MTEDGKLERGDVLREPVTGALPSRNDPHAGWQTYLRAWRPGKPKPDSWTDAWRTAWT